MRIHVDANKITIATRSKYPFVDEDLEERLIAAGYSVPNQSGTVLIATRDGSQTLGRVWDKGESSVTYDPGRGFLSLVIKDLGKAETEFSAIKNVAAEVMKEDFPSEIKWGEVNLAARVLGGLSPLDALKEHPSKIHGGLGELFGENLQPFSLTAYASGMDQLQRPLNEIPDWFDLRIEPLIANPKYYFVRIVFRKENLEIVSQFVSQIEERITQAIEMLERS